MNKIALLEAVARRWNADGIRYAIAHGLDGYPRTVGRDLDALVEPGAARRAIDAAQAVLELDGCRVARPPRLWGERLVAVTGDRDPDVLEVHAVETLTWRLWRVPTPLAPSIEVGPFPVDPWVSYAKRLVLPTLAGDIVKVMHALERCPAQPQEEAAARVPLECACGVPLARELQAALHARDEPRLRRLLPRLRRGVIRRALLRHPAGAFAQAARSAWRRLQQPFSPCGPIVSLVGPQGCGKSVLQHAMCSGDRLVFTRCVGAQWIAPRPAAASHVQHWRRLAAASTRGVWRHLVADRLRSSRQQLVVYEGSAMDLVVSPTRFGLRSAAGTRFASRLQPQADVVVLLLVPEEIVARRRPMSRADDIASEYQAWRSAVAGCPDCVVLRADQPVSQLRAQLAGLVVNAFIEKNRRSHPAARRDSASASSGVHRL